MRERRGRSRPAGRRRAPPSPYSPDRRPPDGTPWLLGCLGMGGGLLLAGFGLVLLALWPAIGNKLPPPPAADPNRADIVITVQEEYIRRSLEQAFPTETWSSPAQLDIRPGGLIAIEGNVSADFFGQRVVDMNVRLVAQLTAVNGQVQVQFVEVNLGNDPTLSAVAQSLLSGLDAKLSQEINRQLKDGLGETIWIMDVQSDETRLVLRARWR